MYEEAEELISIWTQNRALQEPEQQIDKCSPIVFVDLSQEEHQQLWETLLKDNRLAAHDTDARRILHMYLQKDRHTIIDQVKRRREWSGWHSLPTPSKKRPNEKRKSEWLLSRGLPNRSAFRSLLDRLHEQQPFTSTNYIPSPPLSPTASALKRSLISKHQRSRSRKLLSSSQSSVSVTHIDPNLPLLSSKEIRKEYLEIFSMASVFQCLPSNAFFPRLDLSSVSSSSTSSSSPFSTDIQTTPNRTVRRPIPQKDEWMRDIEEGVDSTIVNNLPFTRTDIRKCIGDHYNSKYPSKRIRELFRESPSASCSLLSYFGDMGETNDMVSGTIPSRLSYPNLLTREYLTREYPESNLKWISGSCRGAYPSVVEWSVLNQPIQADSNARTSVLSLSPSFRWLTRGFCTGLVEVSRLQNDRMCVTPDMQWEFHLDRVTAIAYGSQDYIVWTSSLDNVLVMWDVRNTTRESKIVGRYKSPHLEPIWHISLCSRDVYALTSSSDRTVAMWLCTESDPIRLHRLPSAPHFSIFHPSLRYALSGCEDGNVYMWTLDTGIIVRTLKLSESSVISLSVDTWGRRVAAVDCHGRVRIWDLVSERCLDSWQMEQIEHKTNRFAYSVQWLYADSILILSSCSGQCVAWTSYQPVGEEGFFEQLLPNTHKHTFYITSVSRQNIIGRIALEKKETHTL